MRTQCFLWSRNCNFYSNPEVKNGGATAPIPQTSSWCGAESMKHRENLIFTFNVGELQDSKS
jgi:hypothetical protein